MASRRLMPEWFRWSDGSAMSAEDCAGMRRLMDRTRLRQAGETTRARFKRFVFVLEAGVRKRLGGAQ